VDVDVLNKSAMIKHANDNGLSLWTFIFAVTVLSFQEDRGLVHYVGGRQGYSFGHHSILDFFTWTTMRKYMMSTQEIKDQFLPFDKSEEVFAVDPNDILENFTEQQGSQSSHYKLVKGWFGNDW
jgi:hypothetical protein